VTRSAAPATNPTPRCPTCGGEGEFGYRNKATGALSFYCADHRLAEFYADVRLTSSNKQGANDAQRFKRLDTNAVESTRQLLSEQMDVDARNRAAADMDHGMVCAAAVETIPSAEPGPHFDAAGRFIHPCCVCGKPAVLGFGVNLRAGRLGTWYRGDPCKPQPKT
jgi:hypothetical protein